MPVGAKRHTVHGVGVAVQGLAQRCRVGRVGEVPQPHGGIEAAGGQGVPVGAKRHTIHGVGVAVQGLAQRCRVGRVGEIPQPHRGIGAAGGQGVPVGAKRHTGPRPRCGRAGVGPAGAGWAGSVRFHNRTVASALPEARVCPSGLNATLSTVSVWPCQGPAQRARVGRVGEVPQPDGVIPAAGGQGVPVGAERHAGHVVGVAAQGLAQRCRVGRVGEVPQPHRGIGAAGGQGVPVGAKRHTAHVAPVALQG